MKLAAALFLVAVPILIGEKIAAALNQPYPLAGREYHCTSSIGITLFSGHQESVEELLKQADLAMYQAKAAGRNSLRFFDPGMQAAVTARAALEDDLRQGVQKDQFLLYYQPQVDGEGRLTGAEALMRWEHPQRGLVSPAEFIPAAEESGLILPLGHWVLETAGTQLATWAARAEMAHLTLAVNISELQFAQPDLIELVVGMLDLHQIRPELLILEPTERMVMDDKQAGLRMMRALKALGVSLSMDDFGSGYSSLTYLKQLPLDQVKICKSFVRGVTLNGSEPLLVQAIIELGSRFGLSVLAEGVESEAQLAFLKQHGCMLYQGFLFGKAIPIAEFESSLNL